MNAVLSRRWQMVAMLVILIVTGAYFYLRFIGSSHPAAKLIGGYKYQVISLGDYVRYKGDPNRFYTAYSGVNLSFDCERIRDDFVKLSRSIISPELSISTETMVWREGKALHLADPSLAGDEARAAWKKQVINLATIQHGEASYYGTLLQTLFTSVTIHGGKSGEEFRVETRRNGKFDACE